MRRLALSFALLLSPFAVAQAPDQQQSPPVQETSPVQENLQQPGKEQQAPMQEYVEFVKRVQVALREHGFDPGAVNGLDEGRTQAALAQFQLSRNLPASGSMDEGTLKALGVERAAPEDRAANAQP
jgi:hypothetical protein